MRQEKQLLLTDLFARLPYGVIGLYSWKNHEPYNRELTGSIIDELKSSWNSTENSKFLPYLRPMSSMTRKELHECQEILGTGVEIQDDFIHIIDSSIKRFTYLEIDAVFAFLNKKMFDIRELIPKGLALEAPEGMYNL